MNENNAQASAATAAQSSSSSSSRVRDAAANWVASELALDEEEENVNAAKAAIHGVRNLDQVTESSLSRRLRDILPSSVSDVNVDDLAEATLSSLKDFLKLEKVERSGFYRKARLPESLLQEECLTDYIEAAKSGKDNARDILDFLWEQQEPADPRDGSNLFVCVLASSGTGKTQLAATASLTYEKATTIYLNMEKGDVPNLQKFYEPHVKEGSVFLKRAIDAFFNKRTDDGGQCTARGFHAFAASGNDEGKFLLVRILYHLLTGEPFIGDEASETCSSRMKLADLKASIKGKKFLVFLDEVPPKGHPDFHKVICLRDILRYLGIAPVLMSTQTGAQDYVGALSREYESIWTWVVSSLPKYAPFPPMKNPHPPGLVETERPLVVAKTQEWGFVSLPQTIREIKRYMQGIKRKAWTTSPALQLVQLFCTEVELNGEHFVAAHNLVGHHFGRLLLGGRDSGRKSFDCGHAATFDQTLSVAPVCASSEPLLYLALVTWDDGSMQDDTTPFFPLVDARGRALTVREAFNRCQSFFVSNVSTANPRAEKRDGDVLEVLVHASLTLASMKTGADDNFLPGMNLKEFLPLVRKLMLLGELDRLPDTPKLFDGLDFDWPVVPALGGSNSGLPKSLGEATGSELGYLERPPDKEKNDGEVYSYVYRDRTSSKKKDPLITVECKNLSGDVEAPLLKEIFRRVKSGSKCSLIFVSSLHDGIFRRTKVKTVKDCFHPKHNADSVTVLVWKRNDDDPTYLTVDKKPFVAQEKTDLLVLIIEVDAVDAGDSIRYKNKRKTPPGSPA